jgi:hypothetical protein
MGKKNKKGRKNKKGKKSKKRTVPLHAVGRAPTYTKGLSAVDDFLDETEMKSFEKFGCISFASPGETMREQFKVQIATELGADEDLVDKVVEAYIFLEHPKRAVKYLGGRATPEECANRIREVMDEENSFHIYTIENGKWVTFDPSPELVENENYREEQLNEIMREKKMAEKRTKQFFRSEMRKRVEKARLEGTKEGQEILMEAEEPFEAVKHRAEAADKSIAEFEEKIAELKVTKELAEKKAEKMVAEGKDKLDVTAVTGQRMDELASERRVEGQLAVAAEERRSKIREQLGQLGDIEGARVWPENLAQETAKVMQGGQGEDQQQEETPEAILQGLDERIAELVNIKEMAMQKLIDEKKAKEEEEASFAEGVAQGGATDQETAAMFESDLLIPVLRRQAEATEQTTSESKE